MIDPDDVNSYLKRQNTYPHKEDWYSTTRRKIMEFNERLNTKQAEQLGFLICPLCKFKHTEKTNFCKFCSYS